MSRKWPKTAEKQLKKAKKDQNLAFSDPKCPKIACFGPKTTKITFFNPKMAQNDRVSPQNTTFNEAGLYFYIFRIDTMPTHEFSRCMLQNDSAACNIHFQFLCSRHSSFISISDQHEFVAC